MTFMNQNPIEREKKSTRELQREQSNREELVERMARAIPEDARLLEPMKGLRLARSSQTGESVYGVSESTFCITAQGHQRSISWRAALPIRPLQLSALNGGTSHREPNSGRI